MDIYKLLTINNCIILTILFVVIYLFYCHYSEIEYVKSAIDNNIYAIRRGKGKTKEFLLESANTLAQINLNIEKLITFLQNKYSNDSSKSYFIQKLRDNYNPYMISEAAVDPRYTTYTVDKHDMHICLRTRDKFEKIYDINILMYVVLHECAHLANYSQNGIAIIGHGPEFIEIFKFLVNNAILLNIYKYVDYSSIPQEYCGLIVSSQVI